MARWGGVVAAWCYETLRATPAPITLACAYFNLVQGNTVPLFPVEKPGFADKIQQLADSTPVAFVQVEGPSAPAMRIQQWRLALLRKLALYFAPAMRA